MCEGSTVMYMCLGWGDELLFSEVLVKYNEYEIIRYQQTVISNS